MITKLNLFQRALHYKKEALLNGIGDNDGMFIVQKLLEDMNNKINEISEHLNRMEAGDTTESPMVEMDRLLSFFDAAGKTKGEKEVIARFVNSGESFMSATPESVLSKPHELPADVVMVRQMDQETADYAKVADEALKRAQKRVIFTIHESLRDAWNMYMARVPYHWQDYEYAPDHNGIDYFIVDKLEGQEKPEA